jgi:hypothetical protein
LWLEHATAEFTTAPHPIFTGTNITGVDYQVRHEEAKFIFQVSALKKFWERQNEADQAYDKLIDENRQLAELIANSGGRLDIRNQIRPGTPILINTPCNSPSCSNYSHKSNSSSSYYSIELSSDEDTSIYYTASENSINSEVCSTPFTSPIEGIAALQLGPVQHLLTTFYQERDLINN